jgi:hypothetical protein
MDYSSVGDEQGRCQIQIRSLNRFRAANNQNGKKSKACREPTGFAAKEME